MNEIISLEFSGLNNALFILTVLVNENSGTQDGKLKPTLTFYSQIFVLGQTTNRMIKHNS